MLYDTFPPNPTGVSNVISASKTMALTALIPAIALLFLGGCERGDARSSAITSMVDGADSLSAHSPAAAPDAPEAPPEHRAQNVTGQFRVRLQPNHPKLFTPLQQPLAEPVHIEEQVGPVTLKGFARRAPQMPGILWLELFFENNADSNLRKLSLNIRDLRGVRGFPAVGGIGIYDFTRNPLDLVPTGNPLELDRIVNKGVGKIVLGIPHDVRDVSFRLELTGETAPAGEVSTASGPVQITRDGREAWAVFAESGVVAAIDTRTDTRTGAVKLGGHPTGVAITPDDTAVLVAQAHANTVSILDRETLAVTQTFGEEDGIGREPRHVVVSPDGSTAFVSSYVGASIAVLKRRGAGPFALAATIPVGKRPTGMAVSPDGARVFVTHFLPRGPISNNHAWVTTLDAKAQKVLGETLLDDPFNVDSGSRCLEKTYNFPVLDKIFPIRALDLAFESVPSQLFGIHLTPSGTQAWTPGVRVAGAAPIFERGPRMQQDIPTVTESPWGEFTAPILYLFDSRGERKLETLLSPGMERPIPAGYVKCLRYPVQIEFNSRDIRKTVPTQQANRGATFPDGVDALTEMGPVRALAFSPDGRRVFVPSYGSDELAVHDALTHHPVSQRHTLLSGHNPHGIAVTPDGRKAYVVYANSHFASVVDVSAYADTRAPQGRPQPSWVPWEYAWVNDVPATRIPFGEQLIRHIGGVPELPKLRELTQVPIADEDSMDPVLRRGKILFDSANPLKSKISASRLGTCAGCHPDGGSDGSGWGTVEGERKTLALRGGVAKRGWLHASATHENAEEFVHVVVRERLGGTPEEEDLHALARYVADGIPRLQSPVVDARKAEEGKALFDTHCATCHGEHEANAAPVLYDIGTASADSHIIMGKFFEGVIDAGTKRILQELRGDRALSPDDESRRLLDYTPRPVRAKGEFKALPLVNVWDNSLFMHSGSFSTLEEVVAYIDGWFRFGLTASQQAAIVEYLHTL